VNYEALLAGNRRRPVRIGLAGAGEFGRSFLFRSGRARGIEIVAVADRDAGRASTAIVHAGLSSGTVTILGDATELGALDVDVVVEATGDPEAAARTADSVLARGKHVAMVTKEADCVVGPILQAKAATFGVRCTPVDGDQPSLLIGLVGWARLLGLEVVCAGKAGEFDFVFDADSGTVTGPYGALRLAEPQAFWNSSRDRAARLPAWPRATVPDYCELVIVANATGLQPDRATLHAPVARTLDLPDLFRPRADGGLLEAAAAVDMFVCLRRPDEASFAGGVFVVVRCDDPASWRVLKEKGIPTSDDGRYALLHNPVHLLGIEAPVSILAAVLLDAPAAELRPSFDLLARISAPLRAGTPLTVGARHTIAGLEPFIGPAGRVGADAPVPYYMAAGCLLARDAPAGAVLTRAHLAPPPASALWRLRDEQDDRFFPV
jgi:predicted homoserine dehydrogenase-like protein